MKRLVLDGVEYTKAGEVAKEFGYTTDYIGQLCRAKKVDARLVGRSWYVNADTLKEHRKQRYATAKNSAALETGDDTTTFIDRMKEAKKSDIPSKKYLRRVPPPPAQAKRIATVPVGESNQVHHVSVNYEADDNSLIPKVSSTPRVTVLKVDVAGATPLDVETTGAAQSRLKPEKLPDVALSGSVSVSEIPDGDYTNDPDAVEKLKTPTEAKKESSSIRDNNKNKLKIEQVEVLDSEKHQLKKADTTDEKPKKPNNSKDPATHQVPISIESEQNTGKPAFTDRLQALDEADENDASVRKHAITAKKGSQPGEVPVQNLNQGTPSPVPINFHVVAASVCVSVLIGTAILSLEQVGVSTPEVADFGLEFVWSKVTNFALILFTG